jgi:transposase
MTDLINLPYWNVLKVQETDLNYVIDAIYEIEPAGCPHCGFMIRYGHGTKEKLFMDTPIHGKRVGIRAIRNRYKCQLRERSVSPLKQPIHTSTPVYLLLALLYRSSP